MTATARQPMVRGQTEQPAPEASPRATELAYQRLSDAIITLDLPPGALVNERTLAARLGVGRLSLIPALHRLSEIGLVSVLPRRGTLIAPVDVLDVQQVFDARIAIEGRLTEMAAARATPEQVQYLKSLAAELDDLGDLDGDYRGFLEQDRALHLALAESSRNRFLLAAMERIWMVNLRLWHLFFQHRGTGGPYFLHHDRIVTAIERGDSGAARDAMVDHIVASKQLLQTGLWG